MRRTWNGWAVVIGGRLRCVDPSRAVAKNEADRYDDARVVWVSVTEAKRKKRKT